MQTHFSACFCYNLKGSLKLWSLSHGDPLLYNIYSYRSISIYFQVVQYQEQSNLAFLLLIKSQNREEPLDLGELMKFPLLPVPPSLGTQDVFFLTKRTRPQSSTIFWKICLQTIFRIFRSIYVKDTIKAIPRPELKIDLPLIESCWVEMDPCNKKKHIMIGCIYKHPSANVDEFTTDLTNS